MPTSIDSVDSQPAIVKVNYNSDEYDSLIGWVPNPSPVKSKGRSEGKQKAAAKAQKAPESTPENTPDTGPGSAGNTTEGFPRSLWLLLRVAESREKSVFLSKEIFLSSAVYTNTTALQEVSSAVVKLGIVTEITRLVSRINEVCASGDNTEMGTEELAAETPSIDRTTEHCRKLSTAFHLMDSAPGRNIVNTTAPLSPTFTNPRSYSGKSHTKQDTINRRNSVFSRFRRKRKDSVSSNISSSDLHKVTSITSVASSSSPSLFSVSEKDIASAQKYFDAIPALAESLQVFNTHYSHGKFAPIDRLAELLERYIVKFIINDVKLLLLVYIKQGVDALC